MQSQALADMNVFCLLYVFEARIFKPNGSFHNIRGKGVHGRPLGCEPWMGEALGCCGPPFRHQVQHGQQEAAEVVGLLFRPLVLFYQHVEQTPRLQLGNVTQVAFLGEKLLGVFA